MLEKLHHESQHLIVIFWGPTELSNVMSGTIQNELKSQTQEGGNSKVDLHNSIAYMNRSPTFEYYMVRYGSKNISQKDMCWKRLDYTITSLIQVCGNQSAHDVKEVCSVNMDV